MDSVVARSIADLSGFAAPQLLARERYLGLDGLLGKLFPLGRIQRGSIAVFEGLNSGVISTMLELLASQEIKENWCALVGLEDLGFLAAFEKGVDLAKIVSISDPGKDTAQVVAVLMEAFPVIVVSNPKFISPSQVRNLAARVRTHSSILIVLQRGDRLLNGGERNAWLGSCDYLLKPSILEFSGLGKGEGFIKEKRLSVSLKSKRAGEGLRSINLPV